MQFSVLAGAIFVLEESTVQVKNIRCCCAGLLSAAALLCSGSGGGDRKNGRGPLPLPLLSSTWSCTNSSSWRRRRPALITVPIVRLQTHSELYRKWSPGLSKV